MTAPPNQITYQPISRPPATIAIPSTLFRGAEQDSITAGSHPAAKNVICRTTTVRPIPIMCRADFLRSASIATRSISPPGTTSITASSRLLPVTRSMNVHNVILQEATTRIPRLFAHPATNPITTEQRIRDISRSVFQPNASNATRRIPGGNQQNTGNTIPNRSRSIRASMPAHGTSVRNVIPIPETMPNSPASPAMSTTSRK